MRSTSAVVTFATDGSYTLTMDKFDSSLGTLTGATLYFYGAESVTDLSIVSSSSSAQTFDMVVTSNLVLNATNTANNADKYSGEVFDIFDTGIGSGQAQFPVIPGKITLGPDGSGTCAPSTPNASCNSVSYTPPSLTIQNIDPIYGFNVGTGADGVTGVMKTLSGSDLNNYIATALVPTFSLTGTTYGLSTIGGGGNNVTANLHTNATFEAEIDYTYTVPSSTPEPATLVLMGTALAGIGLLRKRIKG